MIKLIASDLDGTLLQEGTMDINQEIYDIIHKLKAKESFLRQSAEGNMTVLPESLHL